MQKFNSFPKKFIEEGTNKMKTTVFTLCFVLCLVGSERIKIHTTSPYQTSDYNFFPLKTNYLEFNIKGTRGVLIMLSNQFGHNGPYYEIGLGVSNNTMSFIRTNQTENYAATHLGKLWNNTYQRIWISINDTDESISVGKSLNRPFLYLRDPNYMKMSIFGISTWWEADAYWDFDHDMLFRQ